MGDRKTLDVTFRKATTSDALCIAVLGMQVFLTPTPPTVFVMPWRVRCWNRFLPLPSQR